MKKITMLLIAISMFANSISAQSGRDIMQSVIDTQKSDSSAMDMQMKLIDKKGRESVRRIQTLVLDDNGLTKNITLFLEPAIVKNTRFLTVENRDRDDDQWIYLPSLRKVKRIAAGEKEGSFMGSDFSYADMSSSGEIDDSVITLLNEETFMDRACYVVESVPKKGANSAYGKYVTWVDKNTYLVAKTEFYSKDSNNKIKLLIAENFKQINGHWIATYITMETLSTGHKTVMEILQVKFDIPLNPSFFTTSFIETGRVRK